ncbi:hypothetical protein PV327_008378 [Microctonus hyperodae]|uniref:Triokinase/FMN cyclase n=1 Tax=Microctonus hyperodae TaxID=165561 RepID=A0AA39KH47_MICHY|nr:hypothetical protein PV327_008378 [Microctonus hyperodae]
MATKKFINSVNNVVDETLSGLCSTYPQLNYYPPKKVILSSEWNNHNGKIAIISGGGSGHEPFAGGFVGRGMLTASIAGSVFAAPPANHILYALNCVCNHEGALVIVPNYTGDCLNFGLAIEKARQKGLKIVEIVIDDDCSIPLEKQGRAGKRGLVGILFVIKIVGALAEQGKSLEEIYNHAEIIAKNIATYGVALRPCSLPEHGPMFKMPEDEVEIGLGVHGEAGYDRIKMKSATEIVEIILENISKSLELMDYDSVIVLINNFGGVSQLEQGIVVHEVTTQLTKKNIKAMRVYSGVLMTSLDSAGVHVSILKLPKQYKDLYINCLDQKTDAPCWPGCSYSIPNVESKPDLLMKEECETIVSIGRKLNEHESALLKRCLENACNAIIEHRDKLNDLDRGCGDGDCGSTHSLLANGILSSLESLQVSYPATLLAELSKIAEECMGGTSGAVYSLLFTTGASALAEANDKDDWRKSWSRAWRCAIDSVMKYSKARPGDRTMLDALNPAWEIFNKCANNELTYEEAINLVAKSARNGCDATKKMNPNAGRASYVKQMEFLQDVDAGAFGVVIWIDAITKTLLNM